MSLVNLLSLILSRSEPPVTTPIRSPTKITGPCLPLGRKADDINVETQFASHRVNQRGFAAITGNADQNAIRPTSIGNGHIPSGNAMEEITTAEGNT